MLAAADAAGSSEGDIGLSRRPRQRSTRLQRHRIHSHPTHSPDNAKRFRALVNRVDDIQEAYSLTGDADYLLKAVLRDLKSLSDIVNNVLMPHQSVAHVRSSIVLDRLKESSKLPLNELQR
jgi:DNA-binding Lrp family transcriptional regulator